MTREQADMAYANMLNGISRDFGDAIALETAQSMICAGVATIAAQRGLPAAYGIVQGFADDLALKIAEQGGDGE